METVEVQQESAIPPAVSPKPADLSMLVVSSPTVKTQEEPATEDVTEDAGLVSHVDNRDPAPETPEGDMPPIRRLTRAV